MTTNLDMIRGRSNVVTLTNNSGGGLVAGDVCVQDTTADEKATTTTSAASTLKVFIAAETIASGAAGRFYESGYVPLVNVNASVTRGHFLFTHTVAKQATGSATYAAGAFGKILKSSATPSAILYSATGQVSTGMGGSSGSTDNAVIRADGTGGATVQSSLMTVDDSGTPNIPTGQTYNINGSPHTHAGGGGSTITESAYASPPGTPADGDLWMISDSLLHALRVSSAWSYYFGTVKVTKPVAANFGTWVNQGSATLTDLGHITLYTPAAASDNVRGKVMTAPSLNYTIDAILIPDVQATTTFGAYIGWSDGTGLVTFGIGNTVTGAIALECVKWTNATSFSAGYSGTINRLPFNSWGGQPIFLRITEDASNRTCFYSLDWGQTFHQAFQVGRTDFITATQVGVFVFNNNASITTSAVLLSWKQS